jgi:hypothetical protein
VDYPTIIIFDMDKKEQEMREEINSYNAKKDYY